MLPFRIKNVTYIVKRYGDPVIGIWLALLFLIGLYTLTCVTSRNIDSQIQFESDCSRFSFKADAHSVRWCVKRTRQFPDIVVIGDRAGAFATQRLMSALHPNIVGVGSSHYYAVNTNETLELPQQIGVTVLCDFQLAIWAPSVYFDSSRLLNDIKTFNKNVLLLLALRDPITRAQEECRWSMHAKKAHPLSYMACHGNISDIDDMYINIPSQFLNSSLIYRSFYDIHYQKLLNMFPSQQIHVVDTNVLLIDPVAELRKVEQFLNVRSYMKHSFFHYNNSRGSMQVCGLAKPLINGHYQPPPSVEMQRFLFSQFRPHVMSLKKLIGRDLSWMQRYY